MEISIHFSTRDNSLVEIFSKFNSFMNSIDPSIEITIHHLFTPEHVLMLDNQSSVIYDKFLYHPRVHSSVNWNCITKPLQLKREDLAEYLSENSGIAVFLTDPSQGGGIGKEFILMNSNNVKCLKLW